MQKWEYDWREMGEKDWLQELNQLGLSGWELCGIIPNTRYGIFKRPLNKE